MFIFKRFFLSFCLLFAMTVPADEDWLKIYNSTTTLALEGRFEEAIEGYQYLLDHKDSLPKDILVSTSKNFTLIKLYLEESKKNVENNGEIQLKQKQKNTENEENPEPFLPTNSFDFFKKQLLK